MCEPATIATATAYIAASMPYIAAGAAVAGTGVAIKSSSDQAAFAEDTADYNARVSENEAEAVRTKGTEAENIHRRKVAQIVAGQRAQSAASGVDVGSGSAFSLQEDTRILGEADALRIRGNTEGQYQALKTGAELTLSAGAATAAAARNSGLAAGLKGISSATTAFADSGVADKWFTQDSAATGLGATSAGAGYNNPLISDQYSTLGGSLA